MVRTAWDPEVTDLFRYCCLGSRLLQLLLLLGDRPTSDVYSRWSGLSIINKKTECILFTAASRVHPAVRMFSFCYSTSRTWSVPSVASPVTPLHVPSLLLDQLQFPNHTLSVLSPWLPANPIQDFNSVVSTKHLPTHPPSKHSEHFLYPAHFQC